MPRKPEIPRTAEKPDDPVVKAQSDALRLLSFRPRSVAELEGRLREKGHSADTIARVLRQLRERGLLNDDQFAKLYAQSKILDRRTGRRQIENELKRKGLSDAAVRGALAGVTPAEEQATALELGRRRWEKMGGVPPLKKRARLFGFLKRRGFGAETIHEVLRRLSERPDSAGGRVHEQEVWP